MKGKSGVGRDVKMVVEEWARRMGPRRHLFGTETQEAFLAAAVMYFMVTRYEAAIEAPEKYSMVYYVELYSRCLKHIWGETA